MSNITALENEINTWRAEFIRAQNDCASVRAELAAASEMFSAAVKAKTALRDQLLAGVVVTSEALIQAHRHELACANDVEDVRERLERAQKRQNEALSKVEEFGREMLRQISAYVNLTSGQ